MAQLSNPKSTGSLGAYFESKVQAAFLTLMLSRGVSPCVPPWPIYKIKLQGKYSGYDTDDAIIFVHDPERDRRAKLLLQMKHRVSITNSDKEFAKVIHSAWSDFNNTSVFAPGYDKIALVSGPLSSTDIYDVRDLLEMARASSDGRDFTNKVTLAKFCSDQQRKKLDVFKHHLSNANKGQPLTDDETWRFLRVFYLLGYDLDIKAGVAESLLQSLIAVASEADIEKVWLKVVYEVQHWNPRAGVMTLQSLPQDLLDLFNITPRPRLPILAAVQLPALYEMNLLGQWDENKAGDIDVVEALSTLDFLKWQEKTRDIYLNTSGVLDQNNGRWRILDRKLQWKTDGPHITDAQLDSFMNVALSVLREKDPLLKLSKEDRLTGVLGAESKKHSSQIRKGIGTTLALMGNLGHQLSTCSKGKPQSTASQVVNELFKGIDWEVLASLNSEMISVAEAAPIVFLDNIEGALVRTPEVFRALFDQESSGVFGANYYSNLLWALETLAWSPAYLVQVCRILTGMSEIDPGGNWSNRPFNSLSTILQPWLPQTCADAEIRRSAIETAVKESGSVGWKLLLSLLPNPGSSSFGTHKPQWLDIIPEDWKDGVPVLSYWEEISSISNLAIDQAGSDPFRLTALMDKYFDLPESIRSKIRDKLVSSEILGLDEGDKYPLWQQLTSLTTLHRKFSDSEKWKVPEGALEQLDEIADQIRPTAPEIRNKRLFGGREFDLFEDRGNWDEQRKKLEELRQSAVQEIIESGGVELLLKFAIDVKDTWRVGATLGELPEADHDAEILPSKIGPADDPITSFACNYARGRLALNGWDWVDSIDYSSWTAEQIGIFLAACPFNEDTWGRVPKMLTGHEEEYWSRVNANPYECSGDMTSALEKLIDHNRPDAAVRCIEMAQDDKPFSVKTAINALERLGNEHQVDGRAVGEILTKLQGVEEDIEDSIRGLEWKFLPLLGELYHGVPISLSWWMAEDPVFYSDVIQTGYRSKGDDGKTELDEDKKNLASRVYRLLHEWKIPPGSQRDGSFDQEAMKTWVEEALGLCEKSGHLEIATLHIGKVMFYGLRDDDDLWIAPICEILDDKRHEEMRQGLTSEIFNSRGVYSFTHGKDEQALADKWNGLGALAESKGYSRLGQALKRLGKSYEEDAKRQREENPYDPAD